MKKITKLSILTLASVLFTGTLLSAAPISTFAEDDFIKDFHYTDFLKVEVGNNFTVALTTTNEVYTFGRNNLGQLGIGDATVNESYVPINITSRFNLNPGEKISDIDAGLSHIVAVSTSNRIFTWGSNSHGQLGTDVLSINYTPHHRATLNPNNLTVSKVVASELNTLVLFSNNTIRIAGSNHTGMLLNGNFTSTTIVNGPNIDSFRSTATIVDIGASYTTGYILLSDGRIGLWGSNGTGQLGNGNTNNSNSLVTINSASLSLGVGEKVIAVATGKNHTVAITDNQKIFFWGRNSNFAVGNSVAENNQQLRPFNISNWFYTPQLTNMEPYFGFVDQYDEVASRPVQVFAGNDSTVFKLIIIRKEFNYVTNTAGPITAHPESSYYEALGLNNNNGSGYVLSDTSRLTLREPSYIGFEYWEWDTNSAIHVSFSETNVAILNNENDITLHGSNVFGQMGLGFSTIDEDDISNYSSNFRAFQEDVYPYLPSNLNAPIGSYFDDLTIPQIYDEYYALFDWGLFYYYFDGLNEKEFSLFTEAHLITIHTIFAEFFEDQVLYGWVPATNEDLLTYVQDNLEDRYWLREDMEAMANYESWIFAEWANVDDVVTIDQGVIDLLDPEVETRLDEFRAILAKIQTFENDVLQPFVQELRTFNSDDLSYTYLDEENEVWLDLGFDQIEQLIALGYTDEILAIFDAYNSLTELEQLLLTERHDSNYFELYYDYYYYFADIYANSLADFESDVQEEEWDWYWPLFENLSELETLLGGINTLNDISYDLFVETYGQEDEYFSYGMYEYWIYLNDLLPFLKEGKDVFDLFVAIEDGDIINYDDGYYYVDVKDAKQIIDMYNAFALLSEDAQDLLDIETISWYYELALEALAYEVEENLWNIEDIEYDEGYYGLFANYNDVLAALTSFEALPEDALEYLDDDSVEYYEYLLSIKLALAEGLTVYGLIVNIEDNIIKYDTQGNPYVDLKDVNTVLNMYTEYSKLSAEAKELLDPEYVAMIYTLALQAQANVVINQLNDLSVVEEDNGTYALFENYDDVAAALAAYNALTTDAKNLLDEETQAYYAYLNGLRADLQAGLGVFNQIVTIEGLDLANPSPATLTAISDMIDDFNSLTPAQQALLAPYVNDLKALALGRVSGLIDVLPADAETFEAAFNDPETKDATIANLLAAWEHYNALSDELKAELDEFEVARLQALHTRYLELIRPAMDLLMIGLIIVHLLSFTYFAFKKRDVLSPIVKD